MAKKIKVRILPKVSTFLYGGTIYRPGDELEIKPSEFKAYIMEKVELPKKKQEKVAEPEPTPPATEEVRPEAAAEKDEKKK